MASVQSRNCELLLTLTFLALGMSLSPEPLAMNTRIANIRFDLTPSVNFEIQRHFSFHNIDRPLEARKYGE